MPWYSLPLLAHDRPLDGRGGKTHNGALQGLYCGNWTLHVAEALRRYGAGGESVPLEAGRPAQPYERVRVWVTAGRPPQVW
jgi:hypothetical protein